jgi:hypothetical protein
MGDKMLFIYNKKSAKKLPADFLCEGAEIVHVECTGVGAAAIQVARMITAGQLSPAVVQLWNKAKVQFVL